MIFLILFLIKLFHENWVRVWKIGQRVVWSLANFLEGEFGVGKGRFGVESGFEGEWEGIGVGSRIEGAGPEAILRGKFV